MQVLVYMSLLLFIAGDAIDDHAIYLSVIEMEQVDDGPVAMTIKVFRDDLIDALRNANRDSLESTMEDLHDLEVTNYFNEHIDFHPDPAQDIRMLGYTVEGDSFFINFELLRSLESISGCEVSYFFELFPSQKNILKVTANEKKSYKVLSITNPIAEME